MKSPSPTRPRPSKRVKLDSSSPSPSSTPKHAIDDEGVELVEGDHCSICLQQLVDRTVIPTCSHEFCFECILVWTEQSRRCPLCSQRINEYLIHHIRSKFDYQKHYLTPLRTSPPPLQSRARPHARREGGVRRDGERRERPWGRRARRDAEDRDETNDLERAIARRRWVYDHGLYAKHVASNSFTCYRPYPSPAQFSSSPDLITRMTIFLRRELRVWINLDVEFLTTFTLSLMKSIDIRSEAAVNLLAEFLDMDDGHDTHAQGQAGSGEVRRNAEHFAHEVYCYLRSPYRDLSVYDSVVQYDTPADLPPPIGLEQSRRWRPVPSRSRSRSRSRSSPSARERERSHSISRARSRSREPRREAQREGHRHRHRSPSPTASRRRRCSVENSRSRSRSPSPVRSRSPSPRHRRRRKDGNGRRDGRTGRYDDHRDKYSAVPQPPPNRRRVGGRSKSRQRSRSRDRDRDFQRETIGPDHRNDEQVNVRQPVGTPSHSSPPPLSMKIGPSKSEKAVLTRSDGYPTGKGKQRADDVGVEVVMEEHGQSGSRSRPHLIQTPTQAPSDVHSPPGEDLQMEDKPQNHPAAQPPGARKRVQNIFQAVQAHLGSNTKDAGSRQKRPVGVGPEINVEEDKEDKRDRDVAPVDPEARPSLLARLSNRGGSTQSLPTATNTADEPAEVKVGNPKPNLSGPEIMARTRARLAKLKNEPVAGVLPTSASEIDCDVIQNGHDSAEEGTALESSSNDDIRVRLFRRLEEEKRLIASPEPVTPHPAAEPNQNTSASADSQAAEAKLRTQAQLRVRLAAAKRDAGQLRHTGSSGPEEVGVNGISEDGDFGMREESLRTRLRDRRT